MAAIFQESMGSSKFGNFLLIPGIVLVLVGVLILPIPEHLKWLLSGTSILLGLALVAMVMWLKRLSSGIRKSLP